LRGARDEQRLGTRDFGGAPDKGRRDKFRPALPTVGKKASCGEKSGLESRIALMIEVVLYTKPGCYLCDRVKDQVDGVL
jgi:hypothetical protein